MQKQRRELGLRRFWSVVKSSNSSSNATSEDSPVVETKPEPQCSLPLLQVWPSSDSPRGEADGQSFVFPSCCPEEGCSHPKSPQLEDGGHHHDSGIDSNQVSPLPSTAGGIPPTPSSPIQSPTPSLRRPSSSALLHPDHARLLRLHPPLSPTHSSNEDLSDTPIANGGGVNGMSPSSSTTSSLTSVAAAAAVVSGQSRDSRDSRASDSSDSRRRSSTMRYSIFDALDLEYALLRAAARGSVGPYSLSESLHKLTFTQSLAFPALARGLAGKRRRSQQDNSNRRTPNPTGGSGLNAFAKVVTALVLVLVSVLVFAVVYKFVRT